MPAEILTEALRLTAAGLSVIPIKNDGSKAPALWQWAPYQERRATVEELSTWLAITPGLPPQNGIAVIGGAVSGNAECIDFDEEALFHVWVKIVKRENPDLPSRLVAIQTPRPGWAIWFRSPETFEVPGNMKLARGFRSDEPGAMKLKTLIETRGTGGYQIVPPSPGSCHPSGRPYIVTHGDLANLPVLTGEQRDLLIETAQGLTEFAEKVRTMPHSSNGDGERPGDLYNQEGDWNSLLTRNGWTLAREQGGVEYWRRPGKTHGISASLGHVAPGKLMVFSTNAYPLESDHAYDLFGALCRLEYGNSTTATAEALAAQGYCKPTQKRQPTRMETVPAETNGAGPTDFPLTEEGNAERLIHLFGSDMRYCFERAEWLLWAKTHWQPDTSSQAEFLAIKSARDMLRQAADVTIDNRTKNGLMKQNKEAESAAGIASTLKLARKHLRVTPDELDHDGLLINCQNGTFDLRTGCIRSHAKADMLSCITSAPYDPAAHCAKLDGFLSTVCGGDPELLYFLQRSAGYTLTGETKSKAMFLVVGPTDTGKSTFFESLAFAAGDYARNADFDTFIARKDVGQPRPDLARLAGARMVYAVETDAGKSLSSGKVKLVTGTDRVTARFLHARDFEFVPRFKLWLAANDAPKVRHADGGLWNRIQRIPFLHQPATKDTTLLETFKDPNRGGAALLKWLIEGAATWYRDGLGSAAAADMAKKEYQDEMDPFADYFADHLQFGSGTTTSGDLWEDYGSWAPKGSSAPGGTRKELAAALEARGCEAAKSTGGLRVWRNVLIVSPSHDQGDRRLKG